MIDILVRHGPTVCLLLFFVWLNWIFARRIDAANATQNRLIDQLPALGAVAWYRVIVKSPSDFTAIRRFLGLNHGAIVFRTAEGCGLLYETAQGVLHQMRFDSAAVKPTRHTVISPQKEQHTFAYARVVWYEVSAGPIRWFVNASPDLWRQISPDAIRNNAQGVSFDLTTNKASVGMLIVLACVIFLAVLLFGLDSYWLIHSADMTDQWIWLIPLVLCLSSIAIVFMRRERVPWIESAGLTVMVALSLFAASWELLKYSDRALGQEQLVQYEFVQIGLLQPVDPTWPDLDTYGISDQGLARDWKHFKPGDRQSVRILSGPFGLRQVDIPKLVQEMKRTTPADR